MVCTPMQPGTGNMAFCGQGSRIPAQAGTGLGHSCRTCLGTDGLLSLLNYQSGLQGIGLRRRRKANQQASTSTT